jgi:hypothetical protein
MPTRKINNEQEAAEAFSDRAFFRVGDRFISPDEIISCQRIKNGFQFTLSDGTTVQHDRFKQGSTGHFLFAQLSKVEGRFSEVLRPTTFNQLVQVQTDTVRVVDQSGKVDAILTSSYAGLADLDLNGTARTVAFDKTGGNGSLYTTGGTKIGDLSGVSPPSDVRAHHAANDGRSYTIFSNNNPDVAIYRINADGSTEKVKESLGSVFGKTQNVGSPNDFVVDTSASPAYAVILLKLGDSFDNDFTVGRVDLDQSSPQLQEYAAADEDPDQRGSLELYDGSAFYVGYNTEKVRKLEDLRNINSGVSTVFDGNDFNLTIKKVRSVTEDTISFTDDNGNLYQYNRADDEIEKDFSIPNLVDGFVDLSAI